MSSGWGISILDNAVGRDYIKRCKSITQDSQRHGWDISDRSKQITEKGDTLRANYYAI